MNIGQMEMDMEHVDLLKKIALENRDRLQVVSIKHLQDLEQEIEQFKRNEELNRFQQWIVNDHYSFQVPETGFEVKSIIILALHHPMSADIELAYQRRIYTAKSLVRSEFQEGRKYLVDALSVMGYHSFETERLPLKRLAVQSGLAVYGRNNITYVEELGSNVSYLAFFTDVPCKEEEWGAVCNADICSRCNACITACPTGAIRKDRFLIDNQRCLSAINESGGEFPDWLPEDIHHTLYDCLKCQERCPLNAKAAKDTLGTIRFTEDEMNMLLDGRGREEFSEEFKDKTRRLGLFDWKAGLPRNIKALLRNADSF